MTRLCFQVVNESSCVVTFSRQMVIRQRILKQNRTVPFLAFFYFLFLALFSQAQINEPNLINPVPPSPNAASLGAYGNTPVSLYTGQANVSVPIFTVHSSLRNWAYSKIFSF